MKKLIKRTALVANTSKVVESVKASKSVKLIYSKKAKQEFEELMNAYETSESEANNALALAYEQDLQAHNANVFNMLIDSAQRKRNQSVQIDDSSLFCRLAKSTNQNYRIDKALEQFHTMKELMTLTACSESRIKSHIKYVRVNCKDHAQYEQDEAKKKFRFTLVNVA